MKELRIKDICSSSSSSLKQKDVANGTGKYPVYGASGIIGYRDSYDQERDYIGIVKDGSGIGRVMFLPAKSSIIGTLQYILPKPGYDINYIGYCLQSLGLSSYKQGAAIPHIYFRDYGERIIRVESSIDEQRRVVFQLNALMAKINQLHDNAKECFDKARDLYLLELKEQMQPRPSWQSKSLKDLCEKITDGTHFSPVNTSEGDYKYITAKNIKPWGLDLSDVTYVTAEVHKGIYSRTDVRKGDILYIKDGATTGIAIINPLEEEFSMLSSVAQIRVKPAISNKFLCYAMNSPIFYDYVRSKMDGAAITRVTLTKINSFELSYPSDLKEQQRIVDFLDSFYDRMSKLQHNFEMVKAECAVLKQKVLQDFFD